jgi:uncharacterized protein
MQIPNEAQSLTIKVIPRSKKTECIGIMDDGSYKIRLKAVPEDGKANDDLLRFLETETGKKWEIIGGWTSTRKKVKKIDKEN